MILPGGQPEVVNVRRIRRIARHPPESAEGNPPESISNIENWDNENGDLDNPKECEDECEAYEESDTEPCSSIKALEISDTAL